MAQASVGPVPLTTLPIVRGLPSRHPIPHLIRIVRAFESIQRICRRNPEIFIRSDMGHHVDLFPGEVLTVALVGTRYILVKVHHHRGHMMGSQVEPRQSAKCSYRGGVDAHDLNRESTSIASMARP
jgi:hypothetical protein